MSKVHRTYVEAVAIAYDTVKSHRESLREALQGDPTVYRRLVEARRDYVRQAEAAWTRALLAAMGSAAREICAREMQDEKVRNVHYPFFWASYDDAEADADVNIGKLIRDQYNFLGQIGCRTTWHKDGTLIAVRDFMTFEDAVLVCCHG